MSSSSISFVCIAKLIESGLLSNRDLEKLHAEKLSWCDDGGGRFVQSDNLIANRYSILSCTRARTNRNIKE